MTKETPSDINAIVTSYFMMKIVNVKF